LKKIFNKIPNSKTEFYGQMNYNEKKFQDLKSKKVLLVNYLLKNKIIRNLLSIIIPKRVRIYLTDLIISRSKENDYEITKFNIVNAENFIIKLKLIN
tara:strand:+ start:349 stop:639 length:291 start_codon:yes stop_codon:yes gene_type:complete